MAFHINWTLMSAALQVLVIGYVETQITINNRLVKIETLRGHLQNLFSNARSDVQLPELNRVRTGIETEFTNQRNRLPSNLLIKVELSTNPYSTTVNNRVFAGRNIILTIKGTRHGSSGDRPTLVGAHFDSQINTAGVNDNGSGMAAMLEVTRVLMDAVIFNRCTFANSIIIVAFDHEEFGLIGSQQYVQHFATNFLQKYGITDFQGAYILDTILNFDIASNTQAVPNPTLFAAIFFRDYQNLQRNNFRGDFLTAIVRVDDRGLSNLINKEWYAIVGGNFITTAKYRQYSIAIPINGSPNNVPEPFRSFYNDFFRSDHYRFWTHTSSGLKAAFLTDTANLRGYMTQCYHAPCDDMSKVTDDRLEFLQIAAESIARSLASLSTEADAQCLYSSFGSKPVISLSLLFAAVIFKLIW